MNAIEVLDENNNKLVCEVLNIIKNEAINKTYVIYKNKDDILASQLIFENGNYQILPVLDEEWDFIERNIE